MDHFYWTRNQIIEAGKAYIAPAFVQNLPSLVIPRGSSFSDGSGLLLKGERMKGTDGRLTYTSGKGV